MKKTFIALFLLSATYGFSQTKKIGDYIESFTNNAPSGMLPRQWQYYPDKGDFVCVNGKNRFTRALYGSNTDYRMETSDKPVFALYKKGSYRNIRFVIQDVQLDEVEYCEARYGKGRRSYVLKDKRWGKEAVVTLECVMMPDTEGGYWKFTAQGFGSKDVDIKALMCNIANPKLRRNGDIGADKAGSFEASPKNEGLVTIEQKFKNILYAVTVPSPNKTVGHTLVLLPAEESDKQNITTSFENSKKYFEDLASRVSFTTPDPYLNTLGSALTLAADGAWDGSTWLHGAIGWRMPLAGWRAGYLGDVLGWNDRAVSHFDAYARSQVTNVPATILSPTQDPAENLARAQKKWGTQMYSNGYICRNPNRNDQMHHYDMNLNYVDELLWHFQYDADSAYMRKMWPLLTSHLAWEKRNFDADNNHLYDAYCCIWASDALYYNGGEVTHSTAYNYRGNLLAAKIARIIGEDPTPYQNEAEAILKAMNEKLWVNASETDRYSNSISKSYNGHWAEYKDVMGLKRIHDNAALWSIYTPIDCEVGTPQQMYSCTEYVNKHIPHIAVEVADAPNAGQIISTSDWMPYSWSINNVASAEIMHTALAFFRAGRADKGFSLLRANIMDQMYLGVSPANLGQISYYDAARGESYRDFGDNIGISSRAIIQGMFGIVPQALDGKCVIRPGFPMEWDSVQVKTPYLSYKYKRVGKKGCLHIEQHFTKPLQIIARINGDGGSFNDYEGNSNELQEIIFDIPTTNASATEGAQADGTCNPMIKASIKSVEFGNAPKKQTLIDMRKVYNANVTDIFKNKYLSPRPQSTSLEIPVQGIGEWCHPKFVVEINDSVFRSIATNNKITVEGVTFSTQQRGNNIAFASLWDNYPDSISIPVKKSCKASNAAIMLTGSTNHMQAYISNALIVAHYTDGTSDTLNLYPPYNYCPIEQDYYVDNKAFRLPSVKPFRISLSTGKVSRELGDEMDIPSTEVYGRELRGGAAQFLTMSLNPKKKVKAFTLRCLSNDIVVGIMGITMY
ncbi:MAG: DUF4450 domain-containing protein [Prevotellaceae bacterium]|nr:DUF4450 domain-containing protein [Prevotellaceae bacterium]